ncbi:hypothetical protein VOLCADRAFT_120742 [Volvox carteri f. nagariensis]|uniref:peptidylprolyl isomerase n=1 Tax=Volvox carteri f. nagariensis TaxID=3068 RepID=D8TSE0_VOLCA|nr:uncharacterized protein VOLCADRAFT_120742 [Volvox carteri f. nagariensis]EFJ49679.1 hypothetical protein VOLCADRAFT_120742 [Volvox carteri f. nagariensis]|eukprot:XP_002949186.1 hypothetical protein VOLCADRAFT_120742 [Volvox carteri f. nagariensis]
MLKALCKQANSTQNFCKRDERSQGSVSRRHLLATLGSVCVGLSSSAPSRAAGADGVPAPIGPPEGVATLIGTGDVEVLTSQEKLVLSLNRRIQTQNRVPGEFPGFIREGFDVKVVGDGYTVAPSGLIYKDFEEGQGTLPTDGQEVVFNYTGYNESGSVIDTSFRQGRPAQTRLGVGGMIPGFEEGIKTMKAGGKRRIIVPPALGPPVGPSTFFSAKQCEVFDVELIAVRTCTRRQVMMFSDLVCE